MPSNLTGPRAGKQAQKSRLKPAPANRPGPAGRHAPVPRRRGGGGGAGMTARSPMQIDAGRRLKGPCWDDRPGSAACSAEPEGRHDPTLTTISAAFDH